MSTLFISDNIEHIICGLQECLHNKRFPLVGHVAASLAFTASRIIRHLPPVSCPGRWVMCGRCSPVSRGAGPCPALRAAATSFFPACAGAIDEAHRPSPETRAGTSRHGPCCAARKSRRTPHLNNPSTEPALLRVDCNSLTALRIIRSRNPIEQASGSEMKPPPKPHSIPAARWALPMVVDCLKCFQAPEGQTECGPGSPVCWSHTAGLPRPGRNRER
jgi:hypothetical protein